MAAKLKSTRNRTAVRGVAVDLPEDEEEICIAIFHDVMRLRQALQAMASKNAAQLGLKSSEMSALDTLGKFGSLTMSELARRSFISPTNTTRIVQKLSDLKLVIRQRSKESEREVRVRLSAAGEEIFRQTYPKMVKDASNLLQSKLNRKEREQLTRILAKLETKQRPE